MYKTVVYSEQCSAFLSTRTGANSPFHYLYYVFNLQLSSVYLQGIINVIDTL